VSMEQICLLDKWLVGQGKGRTCWPMLDLSCRIGGHFSNFGS
jgi:hypothetical protein